MKNRKRLIYFTLTLISVFILSFSWKKHLTYDDFQTAKKLELYHSVIKNIRKYYVDEVDLPEMINESITELLKKIDPYTVFYSEANIEESRIIQNESYAGIGVVVVNRNGKLFITKIFKNSPAKKAGLQIGDYIISINNHDINKDNASTILSMMKGEVGTKLNLKISRPYPNNTEKEYSIEREKIEKTVIPDNTILKDDIAYIKFNIFSQNSGKSFEENLAKIVTPQTKGLIIDLRDNPGGYLHEATRILNLFIGKDKDLVTVIGRLPEDKKVYKATESARYPDLKIAVLINNNSASASEIVSGALQDYDRAVIIGEQSFGKGLVQQIKDLPYSTKMKITTAKYYLPAGRCIQKIDYKKLRAGNNSRNTQKEFKTQNGRIFKDAGGITPDIQVDETKNTKFVKYLMKNFVIKDYVVKYVGENPTPNDRQITFNKFEDFKNFASQHFNENNPFKNDKYTKVLEKSIYNDFDMMQEFEDIENKAKQKLNTLIDKNKSIITQEIQKQLYEQYFGSEKIPTQILENDKLIKTAMQTLKNTTHYNKILTSQKK